MDASSWAGRLHRELLLVLILSSTDHRFHSGSTRCSTLRKGRLRGSSSGERQWTSLASPKPERLSSPLDMKRGSHIFVSLTSKRIESQVDPNIHWDHTR